MYSWNCDILGVNGNRSLRELVVTAGFSCTLHPALGIGCVFSRAWHRLHVFPRLAPVTCFSALGISYMFSRAWHRLHIFPRLALVTCFPHLAPVTSFSALGTSYIFSCAWHRLHVFPRLAPLSIFFLHALIGSLCSYLLLLPVSAGLVYNSALFPVDCSLPANSSCREAAIAFILLFHIDSREVPTPRNNQPIDRSINQSLNKSVHQ